MHRFIELKRSLPVNFTRELRGYLQSVYRNVKEGEFDPELGELDKLRLECVTNTTVSQSTINNILLKYYLQLLDLENRVNLDAANIKVPFVWYNCSAGDDKKIIVSAANIRFEEACVLFNVAASYIQLAGMESKSTSEGLKKACNYYMQAAGVFQYICENLTCNFDVPTPSDVSPVSLNFLLKWSLAAAQECFVLKGIIEKSIKDGMLSKLALATGQMYETTVELGEELGIGSIFGKMLSAYLLGRATYYKALAQVKKASEALNSNHYGEEIARLNEATNLLNRCKQFKKMMDPDTLNLLDTLAGQIVKNLERAIKDNSVIYHETIPAISALPDIGQAIVARATLMPDWSTDSSIQHRPILSRLVPETIRIRSVEYYEKRNSLVEGIYSRLLGIRQAEQEIMRECNLPSLLEVSQTSMGLPDSIIEKSQKVRSNGGAESLYSSMSTLETLRNDARQLLKQVEDLLGEEEALDLQARIDYGDRWTRPESETLTKKLHQALNSYKDSLKAALVSDAKVQDEFGEAIVGISSLDSSQSELEESIPACTSHNSQRGDVSLATKLRSKLDVVKGFNARRLELSENIKRFCGSDHVEEAFTALGEEVLKEDLMAESIISDRLNTTEMASFLSQTDMIESEQQFKLDELKSLAISFAASLTLSSTLEERQNALQTLESAYTSFLNLSSHLQEAINFYSSLLDLLQKLRENTRDYTVSRGIEMEELKGTLNRSARAAAMASASMNGNGNGIGYANDQSYPQQQQAYQGYPGQAQSQYFMQQPIQSQAPSKQYPPPIHSQQYQGNQGFQGHQGNYQDFPQQPPPPHQQAYSSPSQPSSSFNSIPQQSQNPQYHTPSVSGHTYTMPPLRGNPSQAASMGSGSAYMMPQTQNTWQPGMPVQYSNSPAPVPATQDQISLNQQNQTPPQYPGQASSNINNNNNNDNGYNFNNNNSYNPYS